MSNNIRNNQQNSSQANDTLGGSSDSQESESYKKEHQTNVIVRVVWYLAGLIAVLLGIRFVLALLGANQSNGFANFIYRTSHPFVSPFFSIFSYKQDYGVSHFELYTLVAIVIYLLIAWGVARLFTLNSK